MPKKPDGWDLLKQGRYDDAIARLYKEYEAEGPDSVGSESFLVGVSTALLLKDDPKAAATVAEGLLGRRHVGTGEYALAGTAFWINGDHQKAISLWQEGEGSQYADASGGMELPLLLFYASARQPKLIPVEDVRSRLKKQLAHSWASSWPGPLGAYALDKISEKEVRDMAVFEQEEVTCRQVMQVEFYAGVKAAHQGDARKFKAQMKRCASTPGCELENEFFLARHEVSDRKEKPTARS
jgi:hypothetical protein